MSSPVERTDAALRYAEPVRLYAETDLSVKDICARTGVPFRAFMAYLIRRHRALILRRHGLEHVEGARLPGARGQSTEAHAKYAPAIAAAASEEYIEYNISQIARLFDLSPCSLLQQLRHHYPHIVRRREEERTRLGLADHVRRGPRPEALERYAEAVELLRTSDVTVAEAAERFGLRAYALQEHLTSHHHNLVELRELRRRRAKAEPPAPGARRGNWKRYTEDATLRAHYAEAVRLYATTTRSLEDIAQSCGMNKNTLRYYLRKWHAPLVARRRGYAETTDLRATKRYSPATAEKYAPAVRSLRAHPRPVAAVAREFGLHPDVFRLYLKEHFPRLARGRRRGK